MSNLVRRNNQRLDPWLRDFFDVETIFGNQWPAASARSAFPAVNISEDEKSFSVDVVAPGFKKEDFKVNVEDDVLTISAEAKTEKTEEDKNKQYSRREYGYSSFTRSFQLPENAKDDEVSANYTEGVLKLSIPKTENQVKAKKEIQIS